MAPNAILESSSLPLADWFFICGESALTRFQGFTKHPVGVDSQQLRWARDEDDAETAPPAPVEQTIEEDKAAEAESGSPDLPAATPRRNKRNSYQRLSSLSDEARLSISSLSFSPDKRGGTDSNRSSTTIKGIQINGTNSTGPGMNDLDLEQA